MDFDLVISRGDVIDGTGSPRYPADVGVTDGRITAILDGEVTDIHPHDESVQRGVMVEINVSDSAASDKVLFAGGKPLWLF